MAINFELFVKTLNKTEIKRDLPLSEHTTFKIGGCADAAAFPKNSTELKEVLECAEKLGVPYYIVGRGSNLLVSDSGFRGLIIFTTQMNGVSFSSDGIVAEAGVNLTALSKAAAQRGLSGLEFACGIPGTVGGAVYMNAGAYGSEMKDITASSDWISPNGEMGSYVGDEQDFSYRSSVYMSCDKIVVGCRILLREDSTEKILEKCREYMSARSEKQPLEYPSAGSAFKRHPGRYTAQMIDEAGLKGFSVGGAEVSRKHAGFIINKGNASCRDVVDLVRAVREKIFEKEGIIIESEIRYLTPYGEEKL